MNIEKIIQSNQVTIVDVRSRGEYMSGHVNGSINIPLQEIPNKMDEIKQLASPLVLCCASGNRSGQAHMYLSNHSIECYNGGSWMDVNYYATK